MGRWVKLPRPALTRVQLPGWVSFAPGVAGDIDVFTARSSPHNNRIDLRTLSFLRGVGMVKHTIPDQYAEHHQSLLEDIPEEDRFDWQTTKALCVGDVRKHRAYGMNIEEYARRRKEFMDADDTEKRRLSFYLPVFDAMISTDISNDIKMSVHRFIILIIELGLINFQTDYHDKYQVAKNYRRPLYKTIKTAHQKRIYSQLLKQTINVNSAAGYRAGACKHVTPYVPMWLYDAVLEVSSNLNMSISDMIYVCWCIGISKTVPDKYSCEVLNNEISEVMDNFITEFDMYIERISEIESKLKDED